MGLEPAEIVYADADDATHPAFRSPFGLILDRDGVINERKMTLVRDWSQFRFRDGVLHALAALRDAPVWIAVATNQEWVGLGYIKRTALDRLHREMVSAIVAAGGRVDAVYACVHAPSENCSCRKPGPRMLTAAAERFRLELTSSWMVGDNKKDLLAARAAGARAVLVDPRLRTRLQRADREANDVHATTAAALAAARATFRPT